MYPQPAKRIASPSMYADGRFQHTLYALRCSSLRHCILSRYENEFKEAPSMNPCLENNKGADKSVPSAYSLFCDSIFLPEKICGGARFTVFKVKSYNCHKNKIRTNEPKIWQNNKNTEPQPKLSDRIIKVHT